ncbi:MAG: helix-turn-helix domain-containing protein, partial [Candidatus Sulfotelmatobacter sp.]
MEQIEKREVLRVLTLCDGNIAKAANVLKMGKRTIYRKLVQWDYSVHNRVLLENASDEDLSSSQERMRQGQRGSQ